MRFGQLKMTKLREKTRLEQITNRIFGQINVLRQVVTKDTLFYLCSTI